MALLGSPLVVKKSGAQLVLYNLGTFWACSCTCTLTSSAIHYRATLLKNGPNPASFCLFFVLFT